MLFEIHMLKNFPATNLNRDETGAPEDLLFRRKPARAHFQPVPQALLAHVRTVRCTGKPGMALPQPPGDGCQEAARNERG